MTILVGASSEFVHAPPIECTRSLLQRTGRGDRSAFARIFELFRSRVFWMAWRVIGIRSIAEDAAQEVFLEIWRHASRYDPLRGSAETWIFTLTHRRAVDSVRTNQLRADRDHRVGVRNLDLDRDMVADDVELRDEARQVREALRGLSEKQQTFFVLAYYEGRSHSEIAAIMNTPLGTVKSAIRSGLIALRRALATG